jgi:hypothetical protein
MQKIVFPAILAIATAFALSGCDSPSLGMSGAAQRDVTVGDHRYSVRWKGERVEVYRTSMAFMPRLSEVLTGAEAAIVEATGCPVRPGSLVGDPALIKAEIDCG